MGRQTVVAWTLYDFANSAFVAVVIVTVYAKYYALAMVGNERGEGDFWWGLAMRSATGLVTMWSGFTASSVKSSMRSS